MGLEKFIGLPGGANQISYSKDGYKSNSPDRNNPFNVINSNQITMQGVEHPVMGMDDQGNQQMMYPGQDYTFPGSTVVEFPIKQGGGATRADSLNILNNANAVEDYYGNNEMYQVTGTRGVGSDWAGDLDKVNEKYQANVDQDRYISKPLNFGSNDRRQLQKRALPGEYFRQEFDAFPNMFKQRESINNILDIEAPMSAFDRNIDPQSVTTYQNTDSDDVLFGDRAEVYKYDPLAVTPWDMLNPAEKKKRVETYGPNGTPYGNGEELPEGWKFPDGNSTSATPKRTTPDVNRSVVDNLNDQGEDSSFTNRKSLAEQAGIPDYKGTKEQNIALNNWLHDGRPTGTSDPVVEPVVETGSEDTPMTLDVNGSMTKDVSNNGVITNEVEPIEPKEYIHQKPGAWYKDENGELKQWFPQSKDEHQRPPGQEVNMKALGGFIPGYQGGGFPVNTSGPRADEQIQPDNTAMMKATIANEDHYGNNPAIQRMITGTDEPYQFPNGDVGSHFMSSQDRFAVPLIQEQNGELNLNENFDGTSPESIQFPRVQDADYFAKNYKDVAPAFQQDGGYIDMDLDEMEIAALRQKGFRIEEI